MAQSDSSSDFIKSNLFKNHRAWDLHQLKLLLMGSRIKENKNGIFLVNRITINHPMKWLFKYYSSADRFYCNTNKAALMTASLCNSQVSVHRSRNVSTALR